MPSDGAVQHFGDDRRVGIQHHRKHHPAHIRAVPDAFMFIAGRHHPDLFAQRVQCLFRGGKVRQIDLGRRRDDLLQEPCGHLPQQQSRMR